VDCDKECDLLQYIFHTENTNLTRVEPSEEQNQSQDCVKTNGAGLTGDHQQSPFISR